MNSAVTYSDSMLNKLPQWKRELILRKRANARAAAEGAALSPTSGLRATPSTNETPLGTMGYHDEAATQQLVETCGGPYYGSVKGPNRRLAVRSLSGHGILNYSAQPAVSLESGSVRGGVRSSSPSSKASQSVDGYMSGTVYGKSGEKMHHKVPYGASYGDCGDDSGSLSNGEEDLQYGPGIVSKLKNRYMSLAMRENKSRPALRKFSSLEDLLDAEENDSGLATAPRGRAYNQSAKREAMKRARSVDCLNASRREMPSQPTPVGSSIPKSKSAGDALSSYSRKDILIIESSNSKPAEEKVDPCPNLDELKLPIKLQTIKSVFESNNTQSKITRTKPLSSASGKPPTPTGYKPMPKAKPAGLTPRRPDSILEAKGSLKQVTPIQKTPARSTPAGSPVVNGVSSDKDISNGSYASPLVSKQTSPHDLSLKSMRSSVAPSSRSEKSIENTRVLLENRKNAQKSRREELPKPADFLNPKPVVLVETSTPKPNSVPSPSTPPVLPQRTNIGMPVTVPPPLTRPSIVSPINSPSGKSAVPLSPTRKFVPSQISSPNSAQTSTPNSSAPIARFMNGVTSPILDPLSTPTHPSAFSGSSPATSLKQKAPAAPTLASEARSSEQECSEASLKQQPLTASPSSSVIKSKAATQPQDACQLPTRIPPEAASPVSKHQNIRRADDEIQSPSSTRSSSPPLNPKHIVSLKASAPKVSPTSAASPSKPMSETKQAFEQSPVRTTKITTFSSTGDEITEVVEAVNTVNRPKPSKDRWHQEQSNSLVFNFVGKKDSTPDYIENDGVDISKRVNKSLLDSGYVRLPGYDDCDSSTDDWDDELQLGSSSLRAGEVPPPCPFEFVGAAVIIKGRSNLQRQPRNKKLCISFDDGATRTFEYPSEASLLEDPDDSHRTDGSPQGGSGLASYTPSKLALTNSFELGVSRTMGSSPLPPTSKRLPPEGGEEAAVIGDKIAPTAEDYLRPAGEEETVTWSAGGTSDLLF